MKCMLPLFLLLSAPAVGAAGRETPQQVLWTTQSLTAHAVGAERSARVEGSTETLVFDSFTGAGAVTTTTGSPRTFMGMPVNLDGAAGNDPAISKAVVYLAYTGTAAQTYNSLRVQVQFWSDWSSTGNPVFSNPAAALSAFDVTGPVTLSPNTYTAITLPFATPIPFTGLNAHGVVINFQGDTGSGLASSDNLTTLLRYGPDPLVAGTNGLPASYGYRNASARTDFNFLSTDARSFGQTNEAVVVQLYATGSALISQAITNFVANPASPVVSDGSFTVSATGGASGNPVIFSIDSASASICTAGGTNGETISILSAGTCMVLANQAGDATYGAAPQQSLPVVIGSAPGMLVQDGGFEAGIVPTYWAQTSTNYGTPICDASCGGAGPRTGTYWTWFGGAGSAAEAASVEQTGTIEAGPKALNFYVWWSSSISAPPDPAATFNVKIDGNTIFSLTPATAGDYNAGYTLVSVDISTYADGNSHTLRFEGSNAAAAASTNIHLDDISIVENITDRIFANGFDGS